MPPLILHPFSERISPAALLENSKAALMLSGLIPSEGADHDELRRKLLAGRYSEIRMLYFLGKDVFRWIGQCMEIVAREPALAEAGVKRQTLGRACWLPRRRMSARNCCVGAWAIMRRFSHAQSDCTTRLRRAAGLRSPAPRISCGAIIARPISSIRLSWNRSRTGSSRAKNFRFELYASGEYAKMLEIGLGRIKRICLALPRLARW